MRIKWLLIILCSINNIRSLEVKDSRLPSNPTYCSMEFRVEKIDKLDEATYMQINTIFANLKSALETKNIEQVTQSIDALNSIASVNKTIILSLGNKIDAIDNAKPAFSLRYNISKNEVDEITWNKIISQAGIFICDDTDKEMYKKATQLVLFIIQQLQK